MKTEEKKMTHQELNNVNNGNKEFESTGTKYTTTFIDKVKIIKNRFF